MRIRRISVKGLFGIFDHDIPLQQDDRITIIYGLNGLGKTTLLRMLDALFSGRFHALRKTPFEMFQIEFDNDTVLSVQRSVDDRKKPRRQAERLVRLDFSLVDTKGVSETWRQENPSNRLRGQGSGFPIGFVDSIVPSLTQVGPELWRDSTNGETLSLDEVLDRYGEMFPISLREAPEPEWLRVLRANIKVTFIEAQRLLTRSRESSPNRYGRRDTDTMIPAITVYSQELALAIKSTLGEYAALSQSLDSTFPTRLLDRFQIGKHNQRAVLTGEELRTKLTQLEEKRSRLREAGLLGREEDVHFEIPTKFEDTTARVLTVYVEDVEAKLSVFDELAAKIELMRQIIGERFLYKRMEVSKDTGISFVSKDGASLDLTGLSSGEQHELVLLYELLFTVGPGSLILIDEPEISLHIAWQEQFLRDLQKITQLASFDVLIATHSPQIIYDRWDLTVELSGATEDMPDEAVH